MDIGSVLGTDAATSGVETTATGSTELGRDEFLSLLLVQLQMQDPLNPMDNEEMIAQLAQFSSLEQMEHMSTALEQSVELDLLLGQLLNNTMSTTLIGKAVRANTGSFIMSGDGSVSLGYRLSADADAVSVTIESAEGVAVASVDGLENEKGDHVFSWDGRDDEGNRVPSGAYTFVVTAKDTEGNPVSADERIAGVVKAVRYRDGNAHLLVGETEIYMSDIVEVCEEI